MYSNIIDPAKIPVFNATADKEGNKDTKSNQYVEQDFTEDELPDFYRHLDYKVKYSTLYIATIGEIGDPENPISTGYAEFPEKDEHPHPEIYIPMDGEVELVHVDPKTHEISKELVTQTNLVNHSKTEVYW